MSQSAPPVFDDNWLTRVAVDPREPLLPILRHADAMVSWVVALAFLPTLYAVAHRTLTEAGARQGLVALQCLSAQTVSEFIDPATTGTPPALAFQPLLMSWLTALSLRIFGVGHSAGHVASAYFCTAGLIMATYLFARRLGGERLGLFSALLLAFNPHVLKLAQEPVSQSAAALFSLLAMAGTVAHWQKSSAQASVRLLFAGISLGLCLLSGGPVAVAVAAILLFHAAWWRFGGMHRQTAATTFEITPRGRRTAVRSVLILCATGFAVGGWRCLLMGSRYGGDFWWTWFGFDSASEPTTRSSSAGWLSVLEAANTLVLPLAFLALIGATALVKEQLRSDVEFSRRHRGLLMIWLVVAAVLWVWRGVGVQEVGSVGEYWRIMLIVPLTISASVGLLAIIDRQVPFYAVLAIGGLSLFDFVFVWALGNSASRDDRLAEQGLAAGVMLGAAFLLPTILAVTVGTLHSQEGVQRRVLTALVLGIIAVNSVWGGLAVRRASSGDRELEDLRSGLARLSHVSRWTLVTPARSGLAPSPPAQLLYTLRRAWPDAAVRRVDSWADVATQIADGAPSLKNGTHIVVIFSPQGQPRPAVPAGLLRAAAPSYIYRGHEVATYLPGEPPT